MPTIVTLRAALPDFRPASVLPVSAGSTTRNATSSPTIGSPASSSPSGTGDVDP